MQRYLTHKNLYMWHGAEEWTAVLENEELAVMKRTIRESFVIMLINCQPVSPKDLFNRFYGCMLDDMKHISVQYLAKFKSSGMEEDDDDVSVSLIGEALTAHSDLPLNNHEIIEVRKEATFNLLESTLITMG